MMLCSQHAAYRRRPRRPPEWRQPSVGIGVVSSMRPILRPPRAMARSAAWKPGPGVLVAEPPVARTLRWMAVNAQLLHPRAHVGGGHHRGAGRSLVAVLLHACGLARARGGGAARAGVGIARVQRAGRAAGRQRLDMSAQRRAPQHRSLRRSPSPAVARVCCRPSCCLSTHARTRGRACCLCVSMSPHAVMQICAGGAKGVHHPERRHPGLPVLAVHGLHLEQRHPPARTSR